MNISDQKSFAMSILLGNIFLNICTIVSRSHSVVSQPWGSLEIVSQSMSGKTTHYHLAVHTLPNIVMNNQCIQTGLVDGGSIIISEKIYLRREHTPMLPIIYLINKSDG